MESLYEYLGKAAGYELGLKIATAANKQGIKIETRTIDTVTYKGEVNVYPREFLDNYFNKQTMPITLIEQNPNFVKKVEGENKLAISELFCDTIQGEGVSAGLPATFLRLQGCTLQCIWCDTLSVWPNGNEYTFDEIFSFFDSVNGLIDRFRKGQHLILTGGSPLKQQTQLVEFFKAFLNKYGFLPYFEVENEAVLSPSKEFISYIEQWNNSPKTSNSGMKERVRYKPEVIKEMAKLPNSWFKFVVASREDWSEIEKDYLSNNLISKSQIILMPEGQTQEELNNTRGICASIAIKEQVRFSDRLHITIWNKKTGV